MEVVRIKKILARNLLIYIGLHCVRRSSWTVTTLATLTLIENKVFCGVKLNYKVVRGLLGCRYFLRQGLQWENTVLNFAYLPNLAKKGMNFKFPCLLNSTVRQSDNGQKPESYCNVNLNGRLFNRIPCLIFFSWRMYVN